MTGARCIHHRQVNSTTQPVESAGFAGLPCTRSRRASTLRPTPVLIICRRASAAVRERQPPSTHRSRRRAAPASHSRHLDQRRSPPTRDNRRHAAALARSNCHSGTRTHSEHAPELKSRVPRCTDTKTRSVFRVCCTAAPHQSRRPLLAHGGQLTPEALPGACCASGYRRPS